MSNWNDSWASRTSEECLRAWSEITDASEELLLAGIRREVGPHGDWLAAYRRWYEQTMADHDRALIRILERLAACHDRQPGPANTEART